MKIKTTKKRADKKRKPKHIMRDDMPTIEKVVNWYGLDSFVYFLYNVTDGKRYAGYHKGDIHDGYVCSSLSWYFEADWNNPDKEWVRHIIFYGTYAEAIELEDAILELTDINCNSFYNNSRTSGGYEFTAEVRKKISASIKGRKRSTKTKKKLSISKMGEKNPAFGKQHSDERKQQISDGQTGEKNHFYGKTHTTESRAKISEAQIGRPPPFEGQAHTTESRTKISEANQGNSKRSRRCSVDGTIYESAKQAAFSIYGVADQRISQQIRRGANPERFYL